MKFPGNETPLSHPKASFWQPITTGRGFAGLRLARLRSVASFGEATGLGWTVRLTATGPARRIQPPRFKNALAMGRSARALLFQVCNCFTRDRSTAASPWRPLGSAFAS